MTARWFSRLLGAAVVLGLLPVLVSAAEGDPRGRWYVILESEAPRATIVFQVVLAAEGSRLTGTAEDEGGRRYLVLGRHEERGLWLLILKPEVSYSLLGVWRGAEVGGEWVTRSMMGGLAGTWRAERVGK